MTNKTKSKGRRVPQNPKQNKQKAKAKPFSSAGAIAGKALGSMFNIPHLEGIGKWLGSGIGQIFGSGDYTMVGPKPEYNVLTNRAEVPQFSTSRQTNIVCHREYLMDWNGQTNFVLQSYALNPGMAETFPWLSTIAQNYQEYRFHGMIFEFKPLITDFVTGGAPGVVIMSTNYNADAPLYTTKQQMENAEYAVSTKPTRDLIHGIECADVMTPTPIKYVRSGSVPTGQDLRLYDLGNFQFANQGSPSQLLGEIWVSYCVEFFKPILPNNVGGEVETGYTGRSTVSAGNPLGTIQIFKGSNIDLNVSGTAVSWTAQPGNKYLMTVTWDGVAAACTGPTFTALGLTGWNTFVPNVVTLLPSLDRTLAPLAGAVSNQMTLQFVGQCSNLTPGAVAVTFNGAGTTYPAGATCSIVVTELDDTVVSI